MANYKAITTLFEHLERYLHYYKICIEIAVNNKTSNILIIPAVGENESVCICMLIPDDTSHNLIMSKATDILSKEGIHHSEIVRHDVTVHAGHTLDVIDIRYPNVSMQDAEHIANAFLRSKYPQESSGSISVGMALHHCNSEWTDDWIDFMEFCPNGWYGSMI